MHTLAAVLILFAGHRNPFQFVEAPRPKPAVVRKHDQPVTTTIAVKQPDEPKIVIPKIPEPPTFPYRCIGRFGPDANPFAVLDTGDAIINVRVGDVIDDKFVVHAIGFETMTVGAKGFSAEQRIAIGMPR